MKYDEADCTIVPAEDASRERLSTVSIRALMQPSLNSALYENSVPVLEELSLVNEGDGELPLVEISMSSEPPFILPRSWRLQHVSAGQLRLVKSLDVRLDGALLAAQTEASRTLVTFVASAPEGELGRTTCDLRVLARNQWGGLSGLPDILAAFVLPNDPAVAPILKSASDILAAANLPSSLEGYQGDKKRVWTQAQAIWNAVCTLDVSYINPPASFVEDGQRIRLPSQVIEERLATCLDTTVLFASCLEAIGLRPLIVLTKGHAFAGFWLSMVDAGTSVLQDLPGIRNRLKLDDLKVFETTLATGLRKATFAAACERAETNLNSIDDDGESEFREVIDVHRARLRRVLPLPSTSAASANADKPVVDAAAGQPAFEAPPELREDEEEVEVVEAPADRVRRWCNRLLDLSARNRLLNLPKSDKQLIEIDCPDSAALEDILAEMRAGGKGKPLRFVPSPGLMDKEDPRHRDLHRDRHGEDAAAAYAREALGRRELLIWRKEGPLQEALTAIYRQARAADQEGGTNVLYLTIGALAWTPQDKSKAYLAPLILVPVTLQRESVKSAFTLRAHGDESRINSTLLEMLRTDFNIRIPLLEGPSLPEDGSGLDVRAIIEAFRLHLREVSGWEVREHVTLTTLSFAKFLMWKDLLERRESLRANDVAERLLDGVVIEKVSSRAGAAFDAAGDLDEALSEAKLICPLEADSSQLRAVARAAAGESFVLIGPPGTGKSQTIANIVSNTLAQGRTVLFVAEKRTALEVVRKRLADVGVAEFCLDLFSPKSNKMAVLEQFQAAQNVLGTSDPDEQDRARRNLDTVRAELNAYVRDLHRRWRNGWTPYRGIGITLRAEKAGTVRVPLSWPGAQAHDAGDYERLVETANELAELYERIDDVVTSPRLAGIDNADWSPLWEARLLDAVGTALSSLAALRTAVRDVAEALGIGAEDLSLERLRHIDALCAQFLRPEVEAWAFADGAQQTRDAVYADREHVLRHCELKAAVGSAWRDGVLDLPVDDLLTEWRASKDRWLLARVKTQKAIRKQLEPFATSAVPEDCEPDLARMAEMKAIANRLAGVAHGDSIGTLWQGIATDFPRIDEILAWGGTARAALAACVRETTGLLAARAHLRTLLSEGRDLVRAGGSVHSAMSLFRGALASAAAAVDGLGSLSGTDAAALVDPKLSAWPDLMVARLNDWKAAARELRDWCSWRRARQVASGLGLSPLVDAIEEGLIAPRDVPRVFEANYARWWTMHAVSDSPSLSGFVAATHERRIQRFRENDEKLKAMGAAYIRGRLAGRIPEAAARRDDPEYNVLTREMAKKARHLPVRQLAERMPKALRTLTPCLMMSPLSVAQYLPADAEPFDLVIFDEASQIPTWDAIGAIGRGRQVIVVGDPKQLPPTDFFARGRSSEEQDGEENPGDLADLDSILDECLAAGIPPITLEWHYRSRHESLIAFSNDAYYGSRLVTFPSPVTDDRAVSFHFVADGVYERGASRTNPREARAVVAEALRLMRDGTGRSIGIVTFNSEQQKRISDILDEEGRKDPALEAFLGERANEPVLVRNLESIQGDERDVVLFSLTFGADAVGAVTGNFGPLNKDGGERRLNVAITRARERLMVFASVRANQIPVDRTRAVGVHDLRRFLTFAEHGPAALAGLHEGSVGGFDSPFEVEVAERLRERGWQMVTQVGVSRFRLDLGVVDPDVPTTFLAGVECDGATYHSGATARDRDRLRQAVLENLGWNIIRIWSTDWWTNASRETERVDRALRALHAKARETRAVQEALDREVAVADAPTIALEVLPIERPREELEPVAGETLPKLTGVADGDLLAEREPQFARGRFGVPEAAVASTGPVAERSRFFDLDYLPSLRAIIAATLERNGPLRDDVLVQLVARGHGFGRAGKDIRERILTGATKDILRTTEGVGTFFWPHGSDPEGAVPFRAPPAGQSIDPAAVPLQELVTLASKYLGRDASDDDIIVGMRNACGMARMGAATRARLEAALMRARERAEQTDGIGAAR